MIVLHERLDRATVVEEDENIIIWTYLLDRYWTNHPLKLDKVLSFIKPNDLSNPGIKNLLDFLDHVSLRRYEVVVKRHCEYVQFT